MGLINEVGTAPGRGRRELSRDVVERELSGLVDEPVRLSENAVVHGSPTSCPACGSGDVMWGCDREQLRGKDEIHPLVWHDTEWMADSFVCRACHAGWIEPNDPDPITWVRPYWRVD